MADANAAEQPTAAPSSSDAENQEPSAVEAVADLLDLSDYLPPLPVSNSSTCDKMTGNDSGNERIPSEQQQQTEQELQISPEEGPPPTVDELIVEYASSRPSSCVVHCDDRAIIILSLDCTIIVIGLSRLHFFGEFRRLTIQQ